MNGIEILKYLGLQEMLNDPDFADFVSWFRENLNEENYLAEEDVTKMNEMKAAGTYDEDPESLTNRMEQLFGKPPEDSEIRELQYEYDDLKDTEEVLDEMLLSSRALDAKMNTEINRLQSLNHSSSLKVESFTKNCNDAAIILEELNERNIERRICLVNSLSREHSTPLRWCQLDLDNYSWDSDDTLLSIKLRLENKLGLTENSMTLDNERMKQLYDLHNIEQFYMRSAEKRFDVECDLKKVDALMEVLSKPFQPMSYAAMRGQIEHLASQNEEIEKIIESLDATILEKIADLAHQEAMFCVFENNKEKYRRAEKRLDILNKIARPISDSLILGDLLWVCIDSEMKAMENVLENISPTHYEEQNKNLQILTAISERSTEDNMAATEFMKKLTQIIRNNVDMGGDECLDPTSTLTEWLANREIQLKNITVNSHQQKALDLIRNFGTVSRQMNAFIGNGPTNKLNFWILPVLAEMEVFRSKIDWMHESFRAMRHNFMEKYHLPFENDELWKYRQLLWIWFLTDEKKFLEIIQKVNGDAKSIGDRSVRMSIGGIRREQ